jgi:hypothetical protein
MTYKETLLFVGKCLTITHEEHNREIVEREIKSGNVVWGNVVKLSTAHYVFPALYCNLKRVNLLSYLPEELVNYMKHITDLNRERNLQIIEQAKEVNELLLANNITPIFLKGTGNLLEGLYEDIAERMVGDIDFIVSELEFKNAIKTASDFGYDKDHNTNFYFPSFRHYPRLKKQGEIAAIEIHKELLIEKYSKEFNYLFVKKDTILVNNIAFLSYDNQLSLSIIANQINDDGHYFNIISLRNSYDVFLLSKKVNSFKAIEQFNTLFHPLNNYIALSNKILGQVSSLKYKLTKKSSKALILNNKLLENASFRKKNQKKWSRYLFIKARLKIIFKSIYDKQTRVWLLNRLINGRQN